MSDPYLLVAGVLTGGPLSAFALPALPLAKPDNLLPFWDFAQALAFEPGLRHNITPKVAISSPEFSHQKFEPNSKITPPLQDSKPLPVSKVVSGIEIYYLRLTALRLGQIYTRVSIDNLESYWTKEVGKETQTFKKPTYKQWKSLLAQEAQAVATGQGTNHLSILVGDSLSLWFPSNQLPLGQFWLNQGISGDNTTGILKRLSAFSPTRPTAIYVLGGINDLRQGATDETILTNLRQITHRLRQTYPQAQVVLQSILPTRLAAIPNTRIRHLNQQLALIAQQEGAYFLNLHPLFTDFEGNLRRDLTTDGIHLTQKGYEIWQAALQHTDVQIAKILIHPGTKISFDWSYSKSQLKASPEV